MYINVSVYVDVKAYYKLLTAVKKYGQFFINNWYVKQFLFQTMEFAFYDLNKDLKVASVF